MIICNIQGIVYEEVEWKFVSRFKNELRITLWIIDIIVCIQLYNIYVGIACMFWNERIDTELIVIHGVIQINRNTSQERERERERLLLDRADLDRH